MKLVITLSLLFVFLSQNSESSPKRVDFSGVIIKGTKYVRKLSPNLNFELTPIEYGWKIVMRDPKRPDEDLARFTPAFNSLPDQRCLEGWHFRNERNTGPNKGTVNAPQLVREFYFSPEVGLSMEYPLSERQYQRMIKQGRGVFTITEMKLGNLQPGQTATIQTMKFKTTLYIGF